VALGQSPARKKQLTKVSGPENATVADFAERFFRDIQERDRRDNTMPRRYLEKDIVPNIGREQPLRAVMKGVLSDHLRLDAQALATTVFPGSDAVKPMSGLLNLT